MAKKLKKKTSYGIAELYGERFVAIDQHRRVELLDSKTVLECPSLASFPELAPKPKKKGDDPSILCGKKSHICSIRSFIATEKGQTFGPITATCPIRFYEDGLVFKEIGKILLGNEDAQIAKEIPFLKRPRATDEDESDGTEDDDTDGENKDVGRIDMVMVDQSNGRFDWCAVELQAVYFSGGAMSKDYPGIRSYSGNGVPMPGANRRPDFRSSGPKRLMPQLQIKVPTLRRWGKKMAVVVDRPFFRALGEMDKVEHVSNCDIIWLVVAFEEDDGATYSRLVIDEVRYTTLERAVEGLTSGVPTTLPDFEGKIRAKLEL